MKRVTSLVRFPEYPPEVAEHVKSFFDELYDRGWQPLAGRHRITMIPPCRRVVVKIPHCDGGMLANQAEWRAWRRHLRDRRELPVAGCRIFHPAPEIGVPMLVMRHVDVEQREPRPDWADQIDCGQYGQDRKGRIVAYDL